MKHLLPFVVLLAFLFSHSIAFAQEEQPSLQLSLSRDWGYGGFDNRIQGLFSILASGPEDLARVDFYVDDELVAKVDEPPFKARFDTDNYPPGEHHLLALGFTRRGEQLDSNTLTRVFLTPAEANSSVVALLLPLLIIIVVAGVLSVVLPGLFFRGQSARVPVDYGIAGGAVCRRCNLPYPRHPWAPNMVTGKLERCPHCGKWGIASRATPAELALAEMRLMGKDSDTGASARSESEEEGLRHQIEESRYE